MPNSINTLNPHMLSNPNSAWDQTLNGPRTPGTPGPGDLDALYQQLLQQIQQAPPPATNTDQYNQLMQMYQNQIGQMGQMQNQQAQAFARLNSLYDPKLGDQQYRQMQGMANAQGLMARQQQRYYEVPRQRDTSTNAYGY